MLSRFWVFLVILETILKTLVLIFPVNQLYISICKLWSQHRRQWAWRSLLQGPERPTEVKPALRRRTRHSVQLLVISCCEIVKGDTLAPRGGAKKWCAKFLYDNYKTPNVVNKKYYLYFCKPDPRKIHFQQISDGYISTFKGLTFEDIIIEL